MKRYGFLIVIALLIFTGCGNGPSKEEMLEEFQKEVSLHPFSDSYRGKVEAIASKMGNNSVSEYLVRLEGKNEYQPAFGYDIYEEIKVGDLVTIYEYERFVGETVPWAFWILKDLSPDRKNTVYFISKDPYIAYDHGNGE